MTPDNDIRKELEEISPILSKIPRNNTYSAPPAGYFDSFPAQMLSQVRQAKVISMVPKRGAWRTLAAAMATGVILVGGWLVIINNSPAGHSALAADANVQKQMQQVSDTEMAAYVDKNGVAGNDEIVASGPIVDEDMPLVLAEASDQELQQYVDQEIPSIKLN